MEKVKKKLTKNFRGLFAIYRLFFCLPRCPIHDADSSCQRIEL
jgi:hypothetical protein